ncbi:unnamed protein product [Paramecium pentaurelia]|uniref:Uncharacterized protein n=1 Tax=Paramecium pentaurelia TaxID=43138 RepID=A0A8S1TRP7_9CILI|nr:unnamed protein product [Paramecium pentaurelia]
MKSITQLKVYVELTLASQVYQIKSNSHQNKLNRQQKIFWKNKNNKQIQDQLIIYKFKNLQHKSIDFTKTKASKFRKTNSIAIHFRTDIAIPNNISLSFTDQRQLGQEIYLKLLKLSIHFSQILNYRKTLNIQQTFQSNAIPKLRHRRRIMKQQKEGTFVNKEQIQNFFSNKNKLVKDVEDLSFDRGKLN